MKKAEGASPGFQPCIKNMPNPISTLRLISDRAFLFSIYDDISIPVVVY
ncbi:MAG: hypothetical protein GX269_00145 [Clostridiales bacterium]|nr:hypothetical protein [Clostridiales bacterium]